MHSFLPYCVGLDVSKDTLQVCLSVIDHTGRVSVKATTKVNNKPAGFTQLVAWVSRHRKLDLPLSYVMESTGVYHEAVAWYLHQLDVQVSILLPNKAKHYRQSLGYKSKNDKIDAQGLSRMGLEQQLTLWKPLSTHIYALRLLTRQHQRLQELKTQSSNQQHALAHSGFDSGFIDKQLAGIIGFYNQQLAELEKAIKALIEADTNLKPRVARLVAIKGLGLLSVAVLIAETNGFEGFVNQRQLVSYAGYNVVENQSGTHRGRTRISKKGNTRLRRILHLPAFTAVRFGEPTCAALFEGVYSTSKVRIVEFDFTPGSVHDQIAFELLGFDLPTQSTVYAEKAYNHYAQEALLAEAAQVAFEPIRRSHLRRADNDYCTNWVGQQARRHVETDISQLVDRWPRRIHAVTAKGFLLKVVGFILAHNILFYF